ncbi:MAG: hypothetical protein KGI32_04520 [Gammaproteobacteria bacterium]|nr:hypothetical protein [Gammaproteobacteria bacterium]
MTFRGVPDADRHRHPWLAWLFQCGFDFTVISTYHREVQLPPDFRLPPGTVVISNHQRDADAPIVGTGLCQRRGLRFTRPLTHFAAREDLFRRGFLSEYISGWPPPLPQLLGRIPLRGFFAILRTEPIRRVREFSAAETLEAAVAAGLGDCDPAAVLNARGQREFSAASGALPARLSDLRPPTRPVLWGLRRLRRSALQELAPEFHSTIAAQLRGFAARLDAGYRLYFSPEGVISADGRFGRVRAGLRLLCELTQVPPRLLPVALSYDGLGPGKLRVIMQVGELQNAPDTTHNAAFSVAVRSAILDLLNVNPSHLLAAYLTAGPESFSTREFCDWWQRALATLGRYGLKIDPLLAGSTSGTLAQQRLRWLQRRRLVQLEGGRWQNLWPRNSRAGWQTPAQRVAYFANGFSDLLPGFAARLWP